MTKAILTVIAILCAIYAAVFLAFYIRHPYIFDCNDQVICDEPIPTLTPTPTPSPMVTIIPTPTPSPTPQKAIPEVIYSSGPEPTPESIIASPTPPAQVPTPTPEPSSTPTPTPVPVVAQVDIGMASGPLWSSAFRIENKPAVLSMIKLRVIGKALPQQIDNLELVINGGVVSTAEAVDLNGYVTFTPNFQLPISVSVIELRATMEDEGNWSLRSVNDINFSGTVQITGQFPNPN